MVNPTMATADALANPPTIQEERRVYGSLWQEAIKNLRRNRSAVLGMIIIAILLLIAIFAPVIATHDPLQSMIGEPGHTGRLPARVACIHAFGCPAEEPQHLMGLDLNARDLFSRVVYGSRVSLFVGVTSVTFAILIGSTLGLIAGYAAGSTKSDSVNFFGNQISLRGWRRWFWIIVFPVITVWDRHWIIRLIVFIGTLTVVVPGIVLALIMQFPEEMIMRFMDVLLAFPSLLLAIAIVTVLGPGLQNALLAIAIVAVPVYARLARASVLSVKESEYITANRALGANPFRILFIHILPNAITPLIVQGTLGIGTAVLEAAALSFLGLGAQPPTPEWGAILSESRNYVFTAPHLVFFPGLAIMITVLGFNLLGDGMRDALDPRLNRN